MNTIIPIFYACDDNFMKYTLVSMQSMIKNASKHFRYKIHVLNTGISQNLIKEAMNLANECFEIEFVDVKEYLSKITTHLPIRDYYSKTTYYRLFIADMFPQYDKAIYIDSDTIVLKDISTFFLHDLKDNYVGACKEQVMMQTEVFGNYVEKVMGIDRNEYFNAGVLLINCEAFRKNHLLERFLELLKVYTFVVTQDEDYLNVLCQDHVYWISSDWNVEVYGTLPVKEEDISIIHYIMVSKPWHYKDCRLKEYFWQYANQMSIKNLILDELNQYSDKQKEADSLSCERLAFIAKQEAEREDTYLALMNQKKDANRLKILKKIKQYEVEGRFDEDVEDDPSTIELLPHKVDYLRKKMRSKLKTKCAYALARKFLNKQIQNKQLIIKEIIGLNNFKELNSGAIITCNHFNAMDSFAIQVAYESAMQKNRKFYRVIREGNYTNFPGFYGFLMRNCNTLPLSSNMQTMKKFIRSTDTLLKDGNFVLFYPEQSMWWNYRKPKPLKDGAFQFASKNNVPVLPCFITMKDSDQLGEDGFYIQEYSIHIGKPIYPHPSLNLRENIQYMKNENYRVWKEIYEETYQMPLVYACQK